MASKLITVQGKDLHAGDEIDGKGRVTSTFTAINGYVTCIFDYSSQRPQTYKMHEYVNVWIPCPVRTECGKDAEDYDTPGSYTVNGHYHYADGACDNEPPYSMGGPA